MDAALSLRASVVQVDEARVNRAEGTIELAPRRMRRHFAACLSDEKATGDTPATRASHVRSAFNSPFWPFVLATTAVGQEGLDFHPYCHAVVHWNLPSNPVDLEQREGRVHRYKGHAVRKNLAREYASLYFPPAIPDPWQYLFEQARADRLAGENDLVPYWVFPVKGGARIERHVPAHPLSTDEQRLADLKKSLVVYRMVFGQARQEDLLAFLLEKIPRESLGQLLEDLKISLAP